MDSNKYYIYIYLDPRKKGNFLYKNFHFYYEPFYVGMGCGYRMYDHLREAQNPKTSANKIKSGKINKITSLGLHPIVIKIIPNLTKNQAITEEIEVIKYFGRLDQKTGILSNLTAGGDGGDTWSGLSEKEKNQKRKRTSSSGIGKSGKYTRTDDIRNKTRTSAKAFYDDPEILKEHSNRTKEGMLKKGYTPEKISMLTKEGMKKVSKEKLAVWKGKKQPQEMIDKRVKKIREKNLQKRLLKPFDSTKNNEIRTKYKEVHTNTIIDLYFKEISITQMNKIYNKNKPINYPSLNPSSSFIKKRLLKVGLPIGGNYNGKEKIKKEFIKNHRPEEFYTTRFDLLCRKEDNLEDAQP